MNKIINAVKAMLKAFPSLSVLNNKDKNGNKCIVVMGLQAYNKQALAPEIQSLISLVESHGEDYKAIYPPPHKSTSDTGILFLGKSTSKETDVDSLSF